MNAIKICGIKSDDAIKAAVHAGASHAGFVFFAKSPRNITLAEARRISALAPSLKKVALTVDADDKTLSTIAADFRPDLWQLHGSETSDRINEIRNFFGIPVMKAIAIETAKDLNLARHYERNADWLLFDARPSDLPGGNGLAFDWSILSGRTWSCPWFLSGGLTPANVASAIRVTHAPGVDVSSGVEISRGQKDKNLIAEFIANAKRAFSDIRKS